MLEIDDFKGPAVAETEQRANTVTVTARDVASLDRGIHEPARLLIMALLSGVKRADFLFLAHETGLTKGNLSAHLVRLEAIGYVRVEKTFRGKMPLTVCQLTKRGRAAFAAYRARMRRILEGAEEAS